MCACVSPRLFHCQKRENIEWQEHRKHDSVIFIAHTLRARVYVQKNKYKRNYDCIPCARKLLKIILLKIRNAWLRFRFLSKIVEIEWCFAWYEFKPSIRHMTISFDSIQCNAKRKVPWSRMEASSLFLSLSTLLFISFASHVNVCRWWIADDGRTRAYFPFGAQTSSEHVCRLDFENGICVVRREKKSHTNGNDLNVAIEWLKERA